MKKVLTIAVLGLYVALFFAPMTIHLLQTVDDDFVENRKLQKAPPPPGDWPAWQAYPAALEAYLNDHFGMRTRYIKTANRIYYHLFNELVSPQITLGSDGFLFFNSHVKSQPDTLLKAACNQHQYSEKHLQELQSGYRWFLDYFSRQGITATLAIVPVKARIYPEKLPRRERRWCDRNQPTQLEVALKELAGEGYSVYPTTDMMKSLKSEMPVYLPTFFHWHGQAPHAVAMDMMQRMWQLELKGPDVEPEYAEVLSDLRSHLVGLKLREPTWVYPYEKHGVEYCSGSRCMPELKAYFKRKPLVYTYEFDANNDKTLLMTSDSFGHYMSAHFIRGFGRVVQLDIGGVDKDQILAFYDHLVRTVKPTHVLQLFHDGGVYGLGINNQMMQAQFEASQNQSAANPQ